MENKLELAKKNLPTIQELYDDPDYIRKNNQLNTILNHPPKNDWLKIHPFISVEKTVDGVKGKYPYVYMPIQRIEWLLTSLFSKWRVEIINYNLIANSVSVHVRVHYLDPITGEWDWQDGIGAAPLQTDKGAGASDWNAIKSSSVQIGLPAAKSFAVKDAVEQLGKLFGKDLNRADQVSYQNINPDLNKMKLQKEIETLLSKVHPDTREKTINEINLAIDSGQDEIEVLTEFVNKLR